MHRHVITRGRQRARSLIYTYKYVLLQTMSKFHSNCILPAYFCIIVKNPATRYTHGIYEEKLSKAMFANVRAEKIVLGSAQATLVNTRYENRQNMML